MNIIQRARMPGANRARDDENRSRPTARRCDPHRTWPALVATALLAGSCTAALGMEQARPEIITPKGIDCADTPFGASIPISRNIEPVYLVGYANIQLLSEYEASESPTGSPLDRLYRVSMLQGTLPTKPFQRATAVDLNGDGRDEIAAAFSDGTDVYIGIFERVNGPSPSASLIGVWNYNEFVEANGIDIQAGDFDGSGDGKQELAVSWRTQGTTRVVFLEGAADGTIADAPNLPSGNWLAPSGSEVAPRMAVGDFLLDGRDQVVLAGTSTDPLTLDMDLIEYQTPWSDVLDHPGTAGGVGSKRFTNAIGRFATDDDPEPLGRAFEVESVLAVGGNLVDTAAAELVVLPMLWQTSNNGIIKLRPFKAIGQRLFHFETSRGAPDGDGAGPITGIALGNNGSHDSSRYFEIYQYPSGTDVPQAPSYTAAIASLDGLTNTIVVARAGVNPDSTAGSQCGLVWWANPAYVRLAAGFTYEDKGGGSDGTRAIQFTNTSHGVAGKTYTWNFGSGVGTTNEVNPIRRLPVGTRNVKLTVSLPDGQSAEYQVAVNVQPGASGGRTPAFVYGIDPSLHEHGIDENSLSPGVYGPDAHVSLAVGDIDGDFAPEVLTIAKDGADTVYQHVWRLGNPQNLDYDHRAQGEVAMPASDLAVIATDFDGDSMHATIGVDCRNVTDRVMRTITYLPPYWQNLQTSFAASYGQSSSTSSSYEERMGSYTANDVSGHFGAAVEISPFGVKVFEAQALATVGHSWQSEHGELHGNEYGYTINSGKSVSAGEALITADTTHANCYSYDVTTSEGIVPDSSFRACETLPGTTYEAVTASNWNRISNQTPPVRVPLNWIPVQRDWASLAMFRPVASSASFAAGSAASNVVDGLFTTAAESTATTNQPYVEIDLGGVRDISSIRVFPALPDADVTDSFERENITRLNVQELWGFRVYASETPFAGTGVPTGSGVSEYRQNTGDTESFYRVWNVWTLDPNDPGQALRARYIRLQYPGSTPVRLNVGEIQVFGDTHSEPPAFPEAVCDPLVGDGFMLAKVWNPLEHGYRNVELRGDMLWSGASGVGTDDGATGVTLDSGACRNGMDNSILTPPYIVPPNDYGIWRGEVVGEQDISTSWSLDSESTSTIGSYSSIDSASRIGAEFEVKVGVGVSAVVGGSYEFTTGATREVQNSVSWGEGLGISGEISGFTNPSQGTVEACKYGPRPFAFRRSDYSDAGTRQDAYVTDYVIRQEEIGSPWTRASVPAICYTGDGGIDYIFADGFDPFE